MTLSIIRFLRGSGIQIPPSSLTIRVPNAAGKPSTIGPERRFTAPAGQTPNHVTLDKTVTRINNQRYWLYAAADP